MHFEVRPYRKADKPMVIEMTSRTWGGYDHLPIVFSKMAADVSCHIYVIEYKEKIIALGILRVVENGRTGWMEGLRVHPRYKRRGLGMFLTQYIANQAASFGVQRLRLITELDDGMSPKLPRRIGMSRLLTMDYLWKMNLPARALKAGQDEIRKADPDTVFECLRHVPNLVPHDLIFYEWYALDLTRANLQAISKKVGFFIGFRNGQTVSLVLGLRTADLHAPKWCCTVYALDREAFLSALYFQTQLARKKKIANLVCIHPPKFHTAISQIPQLQKRTFSLKFGLFEKQVKR